MLSGEIDAVIDRLAELYEGEKQVAETLIHRLQHEFFDEERIDTMDSHSGQRRGGRGRRSGRAAV